MDVSEIVGALIREHLHACKMEKTLEQFKQEAQFPNAITSRRDLAYHLGIRKLVDENRKSDNPRKSQLEIIVSSIKNKVEMSRMARHALKSNIDAAKDKIEIGNGSITAAPTTDIQSRPRNSSFIEIEDLNLSDEEDILPQYLKKNESKGRAVLDTGLIDFADQDEIDLLALLLPPGFKEMSSAWKGKGFWFQATPEISYGLQQSVGGPCGLMASVQAHIMKHLLFKDDCLVNGKLWLRAEQTKLALCRSITDIIWNSKDVKCCLVLRNNQSRRSTGVTAGLGFLEFFDKSSLAESVISNINQFLHEDNHGDGLIQFLLSVVVSRGIQTIKLDMDWPESTLMGKHFYCTQEMVNLVLSGRAISNLHDGEIDLAGQKLKGLTETQEIGQLSLFEYYENIEVGSFGKNPEYPIWVICSESHYTVIFSTKQIQGQIFDLLYYDGLSSSTEEIKLTIKLSDTKQYDDRSLVPPLELVLGTKFANLIVNWNETDPIL